MDEEREQREDAGRAIIVVSLIALILVVLAIAVAGPVWRMISNHTKVNATEALVRSVATAIVTYQTKIWVWDEGTTGEPRVLSYHLFDLNRDSLVDGFPALTATSTHDGGFSESLLRSGYTGFINMAKPSISKSFINKQGLPVDAWMRPLRIAFAAKIYGAMTFGVWSAGLDGKDGTPDDLTSWAATPTPGTSPP